MKNQSTDITPLQLACILVNSSIGVSVLSLPRWGAAFAGTGGVLATLIALLMFLSLLILLTLLLRHYPQQNLIELANKLIGKKLSFIFGLVISIQFVVLTSLVVREFGEVMTTTLLRETPIKVTIFVMLATVAISTRNQLEVFGYMHFHYILFILLPGIFLIITALPEAEFQRMLPLLGNDPSLTSMMTGSINILALPFFQIGLFTLILAIPKMKNPKKALKGSFIGWAVSLTMIMLITTITYAVFGTEQLLEEVWPVLALARKVQAPLQTFQRLDLFFVIFWVITGFTTILSGYLISIHTLSSIFHLKSHRTLAYWFIPVFCFVSFIPENHVQLYDWMPVIGTYSLLLTAGYPLLLCAVSLFKNSITKERTKK